MLTPDVLKCAISMIGRAQCSGEEATAVAQTLNALVNEYNKITAPSAPEAEEDNEEEDGDDS